MAMNNCSGNRISTAHPTAPRPGMLATLLFPLTALVMAFWGIYSFFIGSRTGQRIDDAALVAAVDFMSAGTARRSALAFLDSLPAIAAVMAVLALLYAGFRSRHLLPPLIAAATMGAAMLSSQLLKHVILERPNHGISEATMNSFPSGHTTAAAAAMFTVVLIAPPALRAWTTVCGGGFAAVTGAATLLMGWHRPSDVLAAYLVAAFWTLIGGAALAIRAHLTGAPIPVAVRKGLPMGGLLRLVTLLSSIGSAIGACLFLLLPTRGPVVTPDLGNHLVLAAALLLIVSLAMLLSIGLQWLLARYRVDAGVRLGRERGMK